MKKISFAAIALFGWMLGCSGPEPLAMQGETMGTTYSIKIATPADADKGALQSSIDSLLDDVNWQMSTYIEESEISRFNRLPADSVFKISNGFRDVLRVSRQVYVESGGAFDATIAPLVDLWGFGKKGDRIDPPPADSIALLLQSIGMDKLEIANNTILKKHAALELDLSAVAKGYGVDGVAQLLRKRGYSDFLVEIGGEMVLAGTRFGDAWRVGVDRPSPGLERQLQHVLALSDRAIATSGDYRNYFIAKDTLYSHTLDPQTGRPVRNGVTSVTVLAENCTLADAMATAIMVMGEERGLSWVESKPDVETLIILREDDVFREVVSSGFMKFVADE